MKNSRRLIAFLLCFVIALSAVVLTASASVETLSGNEWKYYRPITVNGVETGALYTQQLLGKGNKYSGSSTYKTVVNAVEIPAGSSSVTLEVINCGSYINSKDKVGNAMLSYNSTHSGETVIAATNADPWIMNHKDYDGDGSSSSGTQLSSTQVSMSRGILVIDGELWATPQCDNENDMAYTSNAERGTSASSMAFAVTYANTYLFGCPKFYINVGNSTTGTSTGTYFNTATNSGVNRLPAPNSLIVYNQRVGTSSKAYSDAYEVYINTAATGGSGSSAIKIGTTVTGVVEHIYASGETNRAAIGANTIVLSARGSAISKIQGKYSVGNKATVTVTPHTDVSGHTSNNLSVWASVREAVGGWWETVKNGVVSGQLTNSNMYPAPMIGIKQDGTAVMMTVTTNTDGAYTGVRNKNLGDVAKDLGCYNAIVFDGGGSAFMATLEGSTYVRRTSASDGTNSCRSVTSVLAAVYHGADLNVSYSPTSTQQYLTSSQNPSTTTPTTYNNMSYIEYINGTRVSGLTAMPGVPVSTAFSGSIASPYTLSVQGWSIADGGGNLGIYYKVNNQSNWVSAQDVTTYSVAGEDVLGTVRAQASFTNISGVNGRFTSNINLSSYAGQSVDVKLGVGTAASTVSEFLNITGVQVGTVTASTNNGSVTWKYPFYSTVSAVQGTVTSLVGMRDVNYQISMSDAEKQACLMPAVGSGFEAPSKSLSISGYAIVNGGVGNGGKIYWSTDKTTWTECSGTTISNATQANLTTAQTNGNVTGGTVTNAAFTNATADLDAYDGQTVDVYFATTSGDSNYIHFLTLEDVAVGSAASSGSGSGSGSGSSTPPTTTTAYNNVSSIDSINGYGLKNVGATSGNPFTMALPTGAAMMSHTFTIDRGWAVGENGFNGGINYSLDGGASWQGTSNGACANGGTNYYTPSDPNEYNVILGIANGAGFSGCTNARFQSLYIDLSAYAGQTVNVTLGVNTSSSTAAVSVIGTFTGVTVPTTSYENGAISIDKINGVTTGVGNVTANSGVLSTALPAGCEMTSTSFSICGWAIVNGQATSQNCMFVSVDGGATWIQMTGTYQGLNVRQDIYNVINANPAGYGLTDYDVYAAFATGLSADLSSYAGFTVDITVAVLQADSTKRPLVKFTGVTVPGSHTHSYQYASTGNGTHTATCSSPACSYSETVVCTSGTTWYGDGTYHWHKCAQCSAEVTSTKVAHSGTATCTAAATCTVCSQTFGSAAGHTIVEIEGEAATCTSTGWSTGEKCSVCNTIITERAQIPATGHTSVVVPAVAATCTSKGLTEGARCLDCGTVLTAQTETPMTAHNYVDGECTVCGDTQCPHTNVTDIAAIEATCTTGGKTAGQVCDDCGEILLEQTDTDALGHVERVITGKAATCTEDGLTNGKDCSRCNVILEAQTKINKLGHTEQVVSGTAATCVSTGLTDGKICSVCGTTIQAQTVIEKTAHTQQTISGTPATCTEDGTSDSVICSVCKAVITAPTTITKTGHSYTNYVYNNDATCTAAGTETALCSRGCGTSNTITSTEHPATDHSWGDATCTLPQICSSCKSTQGSPLGHQFTTFTSNGDATCQADGTKTATCDREGCSVQSTVTDTGSQTTHKYTTYTSDGNATCTADGTKTASCAYGCGTESTVEDTGSMIAHSWASTYSHDDTHHWYACTYGCGTQNSKAEHDLSSGSCVCGLGCEHTSTVDVEAVAATCTSTGKTAGKKCSVCGQITEGCADVPKLAHTEVAIGTAQAATCTEAGITAGKKCSVCTTVIEAQQTVDALGHDTETHAAQASTCQVAGWNEYVTCKRTGCTYTTKQELPLAAHNYTTYTSNNDATCENNATETAECTYGCGTEDTRTIPNSKVDHDYVNGACKWCGEAAEIDVKAAIDTINGISFPSLTDWPITGDKPFTFNWVDYFGSGNAKTDFQIKFWGIATGGQTLAYSIGSNGAWTDLTTGRGDRDDVVNHFTSQGYTGFVGTNAGFEGTIDLSAYAGQTISINLAVKTTEGEYVRVVTINNYQLTKKFVGNIDFFNSNTVASVSGNSKDGIIKNNLGTLPDTTLWIGGWIMIDGGQQNRLAWSVNGGSTWNDISGCGTNAGGPGHINAANAAGLGTASWDATNATFSMSSSPLSLAAYAGQTITISFAGIATDGTPVIFAELTVTVPGVSGCTHSVSTWTSLGNGTHFGYCTVCSVKVVNNCTEGTTLGHDDTHHWTQCSVCSGVIVKTAHSGGTASCTDLAVCTTCSRSYGTVDATNHTGTLSWTYTDSTHTGTYSCCDATVEGSHNISNGTCTDCGYVVHDHVYTNTVSSDALKTPATCTSPAVYYKSCSTCNALHATETFTSGSVDSSNHVGPFTWTTTATTHTKVCGACEGTAAEGDHTYSSLVDTTCNDCGYTRDLAVKWSGFIDMINYCGPNGTTSYGDAGKISHNIADWSTRLTTSLPDSTLTLKGWLVVEEGHDGFAYSIDGGTTWIDATGTFNPGGTAHITVAEGDGISDPDVSAICFEYLNIDLSAYKGQTVNEVKVAFKKGDDKVCFATITNVSVPSERWAAIINTIDGVSGFGSQSGSQINGALNIFHNTTLTSTTLSIDGWMLIDGGQTGISWSVNDGATWNVLSSSTQATYETPADLSAYIQTANIVAGTGSAWSATDAIFHLNIDLSAEAGKTVTVKLARTVASNPAAAVPFAEVNVTVPGTASHVCANNVQNVTFNNNNTHSGTCSVCGNTVNVGCTVSSTYTTDSHGHWKVCTVCNGIQNGTYAPHNIDNSATCAEGKQCSVCNYVAAEPTECTPGPAATCTNAQVCTVCGAIIADKLAHTLVQVEAQAPTCAAVGWSAYEYCSNCSYTTKQEIAKVDHTRPTQYDCTAGCYCTVCETLIEEAKDAHTPSIPAATCSEAQVCTVCQTVMQEKTPHTPNRDAATCTLSKVCTECDAIIEEATGHTMGDWEISQAATCVTAGQKQRKCTTCGEILDTEVIEATGVHSGGAATCTDKAICDSCGQEYGNALGHTDTHYEAQTATCYQIGWNAYDVCSVCGRSTYQEIPRTAHSTVFVPRQEPTCTATGLGAYEYCQNDGCSYTTIDNADVIEATGHVYDNVCADTDCNVCGHIRPASELEAHVGGEATCTTKAICDVCKNPYGDFDGTKHTGTLEYAAIDGTKHQQKYTCCGTAVGDQADHTGEKGCSTTCNVCGGTRDSSTLVHEYNKEAWESDGTNHYHKCLWCDATKDSAAHTYSNVCADLDCDVCGYVRPASELGEHTGGTATCTAAPTCSACDQTYGAPLGHSAGAAATCTTPQVCTRCNAQLQAALGHQWSTEYTTDASNHWFVCENECGEITGEEAHDYSSGTCVCGLECPHSTLDTLEAVDATCTTTGLKSCKQCAACKKLFTLEGTELTEREVIDAKGHKYSNYVSNGNATCTKDGTKTAYCDNECGQTQTVEDTGSATGHSWGNDADSGWTQTKAPSCTEPGEKKRTCTNEGCQYSETEEIEANGHSYDWTIISNADCEHSGLKKYLCTVCEAEDPDTPGQVIEALGHIVETPETLVQTVQPTCTTDGYYVYRCSRCNTYEKNVEDESLKAKGHTEIDVPGKEATCTEDGYTAGKKCSVCGTWTLEPTTINKGSHSWDDGVQTKAPSCTEQGEKTFTCSKCNETRVEVIEMTAHDTEYGTSDTQHWVKCKICSYTEARENHTWEAGACTVCGHECTHTGGNATCEVKAVCEWCGESYGSYADHVWVTVSGYAATCEATGLTDGVQCSVCETWQTEQTTIEAKGHSYTNYVSDGNATCTENGTKTAQCDNGCGGTHTLTVENSSLGHAWGVETNDGYVQVTAPSCAVDGKETRTCTRCDLSEDRTIPATGHSNADDCEWTISKPATCTEDGEKVKICTKCLTETLATQSIPATGHSWGDDVNAGWVETTAPTCTDAGEKTRICSNVGCTHTETATVPSKGHTESTTWTTKTEATCTEDGLEYTECTVCGEQMSTRPITQTGHSWGDTPTATTPATCTEDGVKIFTCTNGCGTTKTETIDATGHTEVVDEAVEATCTEHGKTEGKHCSVCNAVIVAQEETALAAHTPETVAGRAPTCTVEGLTDGSKCSKCEAVLEAQVSIPLVAHTLTTLEGTPAGCLTEGIEEASQCSVCNKMFNLQGAEITQRVVLSALGHDHAKVNTVAATCTTGGYDLWKCVRCDDSYTENEQPATGHTYDNDFDTECNVCGAKRDPICDHVWEFECSTECSKGCGTTRPASHSYETVEGVAATCTATGLKECQRCVYCQQLFENGVKIDAQPTIDALGHNTVTHVAQAPTCTTIGWDAYETCSRCSYTTYVEKPETGHTEVTDAAVAATCTSEGKTEGKHCSVCDTVIIAQSVTDMIDHTYEDVLGKNATCTEDGLEPARKCTMCLQLFDDDDNVIEAQVTIPAAGHSMVEARVPATCTTDGYTRHVCKVCMHEDAHTDTVPATGHTETYWCISKNATCTEAGSKYEVCRKCNTATGETDTIDALGCSFTITINIPATCEAGGKQIKKCSVCGAQEEVSSTPATGHVSTEWIVTKDATCNETGLKKEICKTCGKTVQSDVVIEKTTDHIYTSSVTAPTCLEGGYTTYTCVLCSNTYTADEVEALGHTDSDWIIETAATCSAAGSKYKRCTICGEETARESITKLEHSYRVTERVDATCKVDGSITYECTLCDSETEGHSKVDVLTKTGCQSGGWTVVDKASCTAAGSKEERCQICGDVMNTATIDKIPHNYITKVTESTCTVAGKVEMTCSVCDDYKSTPKELAPHVSDVDNGWVIATPATCTTDGTKNEICKNCGGVMNTQTIDALGHSWTAFEEKATCTAEGRSGEICTVCGETRNVTVLDKIAHVSGGWTIDTAATCTTPGLKHEVCKTCGVKMGDGVVIEATNHEGTLVEKVTAPTCTADGYTTYTCTACEYSYTGNTVDATGHTAGDWVIDTDATCTNKGTKHQICATCGEKIADSDAEIEVKPHSYKVSVTAPTCTTDGYTTHTCSECGNSYTDNEVTAAGHTKSDWITDTAATCTANGSRHTVCTVCEVEIDREDIISSGHSYGEEIVVAPVCAPSDEGAKNGYTLRVCSVCGDMKRTNETTPSHTLVTDPGRDATCTAPGLTAGEHCSSCGKITVAQTEVDKLAHTYDTIYDRYCKVCGSLKEDATVCNHSYDDCEDATCNIEGCGYVRVAPGHLVVIVPGHAATCNSEGVGDGTKCTVCNKTLTTGDVIEATGHNPSLKDAEGNAKATCESDSICTYCGEILAYARAVHGSQTREETVVEATCTSEGYTREICLLCEKEIGNYKTVAKKSHTESDWKVDIAATCGMSGLRYTECTACHAVMNTEEIPATNEHSGGEATCSAKAICEVCGSSYGELGDHKLGEAATCTNAQYCLACKAEIAPKLAHSYDSGVVEIAATCAQSGTMKYTCGACNAEKRETIEKTSTHTPGAEATCTDPQVCTVCEAVITEAKGHKGGSATCMTQAECTICGTHYGTVDADAHTYDDDCDRYCNECGAQREPSHITQTVTGSAATCTADGLTDGVKCTRCNEWITEQVVIPAKGHHFENGSCTGCGKEVCKSEHVFDDCADTTCNNCGYVRVAPGHNYISNCAEECTECGNIRIPTTDHTWSGDCDETCNVCGGGRDVEAGHTFEYACSDKCSVCNAKNPSIGAHTPINVTCNSYGSCSSCGIALTEGVYAEHEYTGCDTHCKVCGAERTVTHKLSDTLVYDGNKHWKECEDCGYKAEIVDHEFDNICDSKCDDCGYTRKTEHIRDVNRVNDGDAHWYVCTICNEVIERVAHVYDNACDSVCNVCDYTREVSAHVYGGGSCDADCDICGYVRSIAHVYDNDCDDECNECGDKRSVSEHIYLNACDTACFICGQTRTDAAEHTYKAEKDGDGHWSVCEVCGHNDGWAAHSYKGCEDAECAVCGYERSDAGKHVYTASCDKDCNICGYVRINVSDHKYAFICSRICTECGDVRDEADVNHVLMVGCIESTCMYCDYTTEGTGHTYKSDCSAECQTCHELREDVAPHTYTSVCSIRCSKCNEARELPEGVTHTYEFECSAGCSVCGETREMPAGVSHTYEYQCAPTCTVCGYTRAVSEDMHLYRLDQGDGSGHWDACLYCNAVKPGSKVDHNFRYYTNGDGTHRKACRSCGYEAVEACVAGGGVCTVCEGTMPEATSIVYALPEMTNSVSTPVSLGSSDESDKDKDKSSESENNG